MDNIQTYKTEDLVLASYLLSFGFELIGLADNPHKSNKYFVFRSADDLPAAINLFITGEDWVKSRIYHAAERQLKTLLFTSKMEDKKQNEL